MKRRIIKLGKSTYVMSLPSQWIRRYHLDKGDYLETEETGEALIVSTQKIMPRLEVTLDLHDFDERTIRNILNQTYRKGFDRLKLQYHKKQQLDFIHDIVHDTLLGFDIVHSDEKHCIVENIAEPSGEKYDVIVRRLFLTIKQEMEEILIDAKKGVYDISKREKSKKFIDNYSNFIRRVIIKHRVQDPLDSYLSYYAISLLSLIHHAYFYMCTHLHKTKTTLSPKAIALLSEVNDLFSVYYHAFFKQDLQAGDEIQERKQKLFHDRIYPLLESSKGPEAVAIYHLADATRLIQMSSTTFFGLFVKGSPSLFEQKP